MRNLFALAVGMSFGFVAGCQTYDFEPVEPLGIAQTTQSKRVIARNAKPNLMLLVDKSGSMDIPVNRNVAPCTSTCGGTKSSLCPPGCPTRWTELQSAMTDFLNGNKTLARLGMMTFPADAECGVPETVRVELSNSADVDAELADKTTEIVSVLQGIQSSGISGTPNTTGGGTPTGLSLQKLADYAPLADTSRENFILLLTDGLPNCNTAPKYTCNDGALCVCTLGAGQCTPSNFCATGCLDKDKTVEVIASLRPKKIRTIVVGFGLDGNGQDTLNAMAEAGGFGLTCPDGTDAECGAGNSCNTATKTCTRQFYQASNAAELAQALIAIGNLVGNSNPCEYKLEEKPSDRRFLTVLIDGENVSESATTWQYDDTDGIVTFKAGICQRLESATSSNPVDVEFRIVQGL